MDVPLRGGRLPGRSHGGPGWRTWLACGLCVLVPGATALAIEAFAADPRRMGAEVELGQRYALEVPVTIHARCNSSGCGGSGTTSEHVDRLEGLKLTLELTPSAAASTHKQTIVLVTPRDFVSPLTGHLELIGPPELSEGRQKELKAQFRQRCEDLEFEGVEARGFEAKPIPRRR